MFQISLWSAPRSHGRKDHNLCVLQVRVVYLRLGSVSKSASIATSQRFSGVVRTWTAREWAPYRPFPPRTFGTI